MLVEARAQNPVALGEQIGTIEAALAAVRTSEPVRFSTDAQECARLWNVRKGMFPSVGAMRDVGTTVIIEDVAFPVPRLAEATLDLQRLLAEHGYADAIIFGHALEGNLHFVFTQDFNVAAEIQRYRGFMDALSEWSSKNTTVRSRPNMVRAATSHPSWSSNGAPKRTRSCVGSNNYSIREVC